MVRLEGTTEVIVCFQPPEEDTVTCRGDFAPLTLLSTLAVAFSSFCLRTPPFPSLKEILTTLTQAGREAPFLLVVLLC